MDKSGKYDIKLLDKDLFANIYYKLMKTRIVILIVVFTFVENLNRWGL